MKSLNDVFHEAVDFGVDGEVPAGTPVGVAKLSHVLRVYNAIMGGGLGFAMEVIEPAEFERAVEGFRYLGLGADANLLAELVESYGSPDYDFGRQDILEHSLNVGSPVFDAFQRKVAEIPTDFGFDG